MEKKFLATVILPAMYDPLTVGHMNSLKYLSERCDKVFAVIMTLPAGEGDRFVPSQTLKTLIEQAVAAEGLDNVSVYIEDEGWLARSVEELGANGVARSFHPSINIEKEMELIHTVIELGVPVHLIPSTLDLRSSEIRVLVEEGFLDEIREQVPDSVFRYFQQQK